MDLQDRLVLLDSKEEEELRVHRVQLDSLDQQEELAHQAQLVPSVRLAHWVPQGKRVLSVCVETTDPQEDWVRGAPPDPQAA